MWSEDSGYYASGQLLDLGLFNGPVSDAYEPNIAIEMKWTYLTKKGGFKQNKLNHFKHDVEKLQQCHKKDTDKYVMQFMFLPQNFFSGFQTLNDFVEQLTMQVNQSVDHRKLKNKKIVLIHKDSFPTFGCTETDKYQFFLLLWKIV